MRGNFVIDEYIYNKPFNRRTVHNQDNQMICHMLCFGDLKSLAFSLTSIKYIIKVLI